jgi:DNA-binding beta-propeller fold protein YncE
VRGRRRGRRGGRARAGGRGRPPGVLLTAIAALTLLSGCDSSLQFYADNRDPDAPVLGLGGPAPYIGLTGRPAVPETAAVRPPDAVDTARAGAGKPNVYAWTGPDMLTQVTRRFPARVYVPNARRHTIDVIDQHSFRIIGHVPVGSAPRYVVPSWDLRTLWVNDTAGGGLVPIDPLTGRRGQAVPVADPYDLYFTPDGRNALVITAEPGRVDVRDPHTMRLRGSLPVPCRGLGEADFSATGSFLVASCELSGQLVRIDLRRGRVSGLLALRPHARPQDVRLSPDGTVFYVADMASNGVWLIDAKRFRTMGFVRTGRGARSLYLSRDAELLYVANPGNGTISLIDIATHRVVQQWRLPGAPDMGGISADGRVLWLAGRRDGAVYAISTETGRPLRRISVGPGLYGLSVYPQPGRYSLGHIGHYR